MSEQEIDQLRQRAALAEMNKRGSYRPFLASRIVQAIREAEAAAGYVTAKLETLESAKERRG